MKKRCFLSSASSESGPTRHYFPPCTPASHVHLAQAHTRWASSVAFPVAKIRIGKHYLFSITQDRLRAKICISNRAINLNRIHKNATVRACFSAWCDKLPRVKWSPVWNFQNKFLIIKARQNRQQEFAMAAELKSIIMLESMPQLLKAKRMRTLNF